MQVMQFWCLVLRLVSLADDWPRSTRAWNCARALATALGASAPAAASPSSFLTNFQPPVFLNSTGVQSKPTATNVSSLMKRRSRKGRSRYLTTATSDGELMSTTHSVESWPVKARRAPDGDQRRPVTQPRQLSNWATGSPNAGSVPNGVAGGFLSTPLMAAEKMRHL
eukprot:TRINITY_DN3735_c0_g1_i2.p2 TRINITY_DN3735_c0_g1~~TRINITY_DN3735_c0_g1_i2.p2  ORF type:complete len:167 (-),score=29.89 TRINITY_DN3735_c0_g1_i2:522-1022(-)